MLVRRGPAVAILLTLAFVHRAAAAPGADIVTTIGSIGPIQVKAFASDDPAVRAGCVTPGTHRIIPFTLSADNAGSGNIEAGQVPPAPCGQCPCGSGLTNGIFTWSDRICAWEVGGFSDFMLLLGLFGDWIQWGTRESSCVTDSVAWRPGAPANPLFRCGPVSPQGIQPGWRRNITNSVCQFVVADSLMDREYRILATTNRSLSIAEERVGNNSTAASFALRGGQLVTPAPSAWLFGAPVGTSGVSFLPSATSGDIAITNMYWTNGGIDHLRVEQGIFSNTGHLAPPAGASLSLSPVTVSWGPGRVDLFVRDGNNRMWHAWGDAYQLQGWDNPAGISDMHSQPSAVAFAPGRLDIFWLNGAGSLQHTWWGPGWFNEDLGHPANVSLVNNPGAVAEGFNAMDIFVAGSDGRLWHKGWFNGWTAWSSAPQVSGINGTPAAVSPTPGRADAFWWTSGNNIQHIGRVNGAWTPLDAFFPGPGGGVVNSSPTAVSWGPTRMDVFWRTSVNRLTHLIWNSGNWSFGAPPSDPVLTSPSAVSWANGRLDVVFGTTDGRLGHLRWF